MNGTSSPESLPPRIPSLTPKKQTEMFYRDLKKAKETYHESHRSDKLTVHHLLNAESLSVVFEGELDSDITTCVAFAREWDLVKEWNAFVIKSEMLRIVSVLELIVSSEVWMPWPFKNRNMCVRTVGYDVTSDMGCFFIRMTPEDPRLSDPKEEMTPIYCDGRIVLTPISNKKTKVELMITVRENRMKYVPNWLLSAILKVYTPRTFAKMNQLVCVAAEIQQKGGLDKLKKEGKISLADLEVCDAVVKRMQKNVGLYVVVFESLYSSAKSTTLELKHRYSNFLTARASAILTKNNTTE